MCNIKVTPKSRAEDREQEKGKECWSGEAVKG